MTTNEDILNCLNNMKIQADTNNKELRRDVMKKMDDIDKKVEKAKEVAKEKDRKDEAKIEEIQKRLATIENNLAITMETCKRKEREQQQKRTNEFKRNVGLEVTEDEPVKKAKTWSELIEESKRAEKEKREKEAAVQQKHWKTQVQVRKKVDKMLEKAVEPEKEKETVKEKVTEDKETKDLKLNAGSSHDE